MKKTRLLVLLRSIWATKVSFCSVLLFVGLGIGIFLGIRWNGPALEQTADAYYEEHAFHDFAVSYPYGISDEDIAAIAALEGVTQVEGGYSAESTIRIGEEAYVVTAQSLTRELNTATAVEGALPAAPDEVGIERRMATELGLKVGDTLTVHAKRAGIDSLNGDTFKVVGIVDHPAYISIHASYARGTTSIGNGSVSFYMLMTEDAFNKTAYGGCYSNAYVRSDSLRGMNSFGDEYREKANPIAASLSELGALRAPQRYDAFVSQVQSMVDEAQQAVAQGEAQVAAGEEELAAKQSELDAAEAQIAAGEQELAAAQDQIAAGEQELASAQSAYAQGRSSYDEGAAALETGLDEFQQARLEQQKEINEKLRQIKTQAPIARAVAEIWWQYKGFPESEDGDWLIYDDPAQAQGQIAAIMAILDGALKGVNALADPELPEEAVAAVDTLTRTVQALAAASDKIDQYMGGVAQLEALAAQLSDAAQSISDGREKLEAAKAELEEKRELLASGKTQLEEAKAQFESGKAQLEEGRAAVEEGRAQLAQAQEALSQLVPVPSWILERRTDNISFNVAHEYGKAGERLCYSLALLFVFVGVMICYTSISRIVNEQQVMTGVEKALGFSKGEILAHYMQYALLTVLCGAALGGVLGYFVLEKITNSTLSATFVIGVFRSYFSLKDLLIIFAAELVLICLAAWIACSKQISRRAIDLLRGEKQSKRRAHFYEKTRWWKKLSLYQQLTINNVVNDRTRVIATLVGVIGCTALIVMALTFRMALQNTPLKHFANVSHYDERLVSDDQVDGAMDNLTLALSGEGVDYTAVFQKNWYLRGADGSMRTADIIVAQDAQALSKFFHFRDAKSKRELALPENGVLLSQVYTKYHDVGVGDTITLINMEGESCEFVVAGVIEHYLSANQVFMTGSAYESVMGAAAVPNTFYINLNGADEGALRARLAGVEGFFSMTDDHARWIRVFATFQSTTSLVVAIALMLSAVMSLLVLLNLNVVLIQERTRELIVMRINGFSVKDTKKYIYRDNIVLTAIGMILGVGAGMLLSIYVISSVASENSTIITDQNAIACLIGVGITVFFTVLTNLIALRRIDKLKVSDLNKL